MRSSSRLIALALALVVLTSTCGSSTGPGPGGPTQAAWTADLARPPSEVVTGEDAVVVGTDSPVTLTAYDPDDGKVLWERQFEDASSGFGLVAGKEGPMLSYGTEDAGRLHLLEWETGDEIWAVDTEGGLYDMWADETDGLGFVSYDETEGGWLDMSNGEQTPATDEYLFPINNQLARVGPDGLEVGFDPFDPDGPTDTIAFDIDAVDGESFALADEVLIATDGSELVGFVDGEERWRTDAGVGQVRGMVVVGDHLIVIGDNRELGFAVARVDESSAQVFDGVPDAAQVLNALEVDGRTLLVAAVEREGVGGTDPDTVVLLAADDELHEIGTNEAEDVTRTWFVGSRVAVTDLNQREVTVLSTENARELATIAGDVYGTLEAFEGPNGYIVISSDQQLTLHR